jgi:Protein of unknown function (DUF3667)
MQEINIISCKNCGNSFAGKFCNNCGEKVYTDHDKSFAHIFEEIFHFITHFDNKFFRTLKLFFTRPGFVSTQFCNGVRNKYFRPFSVFMIGVILYLFFPILQGLNMSFGSHLVNNRAFHIGFVEKWAVKKAHNQGISLEELAVKFNKKSPGVSKLLLILIIPLTALALSAVFYKSHKYYFDHFILAAEINSFYLFFVFLIVPIFFRLVDRVGNLIHPGFDFELADPISLSLHFIALPIFCFVAFKRFYQSKTFAAIGKTLLFLLLHSFIVMILYRLILYSVVMLFI